MLVKKKKLRMRIGKFLRDGYGNNEFKELESKKIKFGDDERILRIFEVSFEYGMIENFKERRYKGSDIIDNLDCLLEMYENYRFGGGLELDKIVYNEGKIYLLFGYNSIDKKEVRLFINDYYE